MHEQVNALFIANDSIYRINNDYCLVDIAGNTLSYAIPELALEDYVNELIEAEKSCK